MLVLCSNGLSSSNLRNAIKAKMGRIASAALVVTADEAYKADNYHVPRCLEELRLLGLEAAVLDIDADPAERLLDFDLVEFIGGNPFYLMDAIRKRRAGPVLRALAEERILVGWSAAAFAFGPTLNLVNRYSPELNAAGPGDLRGLGLTNVEVLPHYRRYAARRADFEAICAAYEAERGVNVIRLDDGDGVLVDGGHVAIIRGSEPTAKEQTT